jgi:hypothetical protein
MCKVMSQEQGITETSTLPRCLLHAFFYIAPSFFMLCKAVGAPLCHNMRPVLSSHLRV